MKLPRLQIQTIDGLSSDIQSTPLASTIYAFDVKLAKENPYSTQAGDGIPGRNLRVTWHFQSEPGGSSPKVIAQRWHDQAWLANNPDDPLTLCKKAFDAFFHMKTCIRERRGFDAFDITQPSCRVENTRIAACLVGMGHPVIGWHWTDFGAAWHFDQTAATDAALLHDEHLIGKLPNTTISYVKGAIFGHAAMLGVVKEIQSTRIEHKGRTAIIGKHIPKAKLDSLEKILFRK